jgi:capsular polysaccharide biosynthesis protein
MELHQFAAILIKKKQTVMFVVILFLIGAAVITFVQPMQYASWAKILVVQNYSPKTDAYVVSRSNEYLSTVLAQVINTNSFFNEVMNSGFDINKSYFGENWNSTAVFSKLADYFLPVYFWQHIISYDQTNVRHSCR